MLTNEYTYYEVSQVRIVKVYKIHMQLKSNIHTYGDAEA